MKKMINRVAICLLAAAFLWLGSVFADRDRLSGELIRLHVVANSDTEADQNLKLQVRDAITRSLQEALSSVKDTEAARTYLRENLPKIQTIANETLKSLGSGDRAVVSLCEEAFDTRYYDTFTLPAGVYEALRIVIGNGEGKNWWCVVFPSLCIPATSEGFSHAAAGAGFPESLKDSLTGEESCELRFYLLDVLGKAENILFPG